METANGPYRQPAPLPALHARLLDWYAAAARDLPWRRTRDPYRVLVAEVMLQQTGVGRVLERYEPFLTRFPTVESLVQAPAADVIRAWAPLGYNRRAVNLQRAAQVIVAEHGGALPGDVATLRRLPGVGSYTAAALACFALERDVAVVDTNIRRVLGRLLRGPEPVSLSEAWRLADSARPSGQSSAWHQALMDLGATVCLVGRPRCAVCPARDLCAAAPSFEVAPRPIARVAERRESPYLNSSRFYRGRIVQALREAGGPLALADLGRRIRPGYGPENEPWLRDLLAGLERDGLVHVDGGEAGLP